MCMFLSGTLGKRRCTGNSAGCGKSEEGERTVGGTEVNDSVSARGVTCPSQKAVGLMSGTQAPNTVGDHTVEPKVSSLES